MILKIIFFLGDEISPDNCRLWDLNQQNDTIVSLDKDRFRNDLGGLIEAYSEIYRRINDFILKDSLWNALFSLIEKYYAKRFLEI